MVTLGAVLVSCLATTSCGSAPGPVPPCPLLEVREIQARIDASWSQGRQWESEGNTDAIGCNFRSPRGFVTIWSEEKNAAEYYRSSRDAPVQQPQEDMGGVGYEGYAYTSPGNVQEVHLLKGDAYIQVIVGAGAVPGTARHFGDLVVARLP
ncbi:hypothetical protein MXD63_28575 [Frankia sp. Cpl3]|nr:hypothetical protein [Frankia sp. Cpl3]